MQVDHHMNGNRRTLHADHYTTDASFETDRALLMRSWQLAGHKRQIANPGDFITFTLFDQELFLIHGADGDIRAFYNVCPHRGHQLVAGTGNKKRITCPYHAWTFTQVGALMGMKRTKTTQAPDRSQIKLTQVPVSHLAGFLFVNLDPKATPLAEFAPGLEAQVLQECPDVTSLVIEDGAALGHSYECAANWKVLLDNYLECHHCDTAHDSFNDMMDIASSRFELFERHTFQVAPTALKPASKAFPLNLDHDITTGKFWFLFPNTTFGQFPGVPGFYASRFEPVTPHLTNRHSISLTVAEPTDSDMARRHHLRSEWSRNVVSQEDKALCQSVQRGMRQNGYQQGWYVTDPDAHGISEHAMRHFHQIYQDAIS